MSDFRNDPPRTGTAGTTTGSSSFDPQAEIDALREKVEALMAERVSPALSAVADQAGSLAQGAAETVRRQSDHLAGTVRAQPFVAVGAAALAGLAVGLLIRR